MQVFRNNIKTLMLFVTFLFNVINSLGQLPIKNKSNWKWVKSDINSTDIQWKLMHKDTMAMQLYFSHDTLKYGQLTDKFAPLGKYNFHKYQFDDEYVRNPIKDLTYYSLCYSDTFELHFWEPYSPGDELIGYIFNKQDSSFIDSFNYLNYPVWKKTICRKDLIDSDKFTNNKYTGYVYRICLIRNNKRTYKDHPLELIYFE